MPWGDRTGPRGYGPRTGRGLGYCAGYPSPGYTRGAGMGMGWGRGGGRGWGRGRGWGWTGTFYDPYYGPPAAVPAYLPGPTPPDPEQEAKYLEQTLSNLRKEIEAIEKRLVKLAEEAKD
jgi:hypothetical protein